MEREYNDFSSKFYKIRSEFDSERFKIYQMCYNEIVEIIKENVMGNDEERICLDDDSIGIMKKDSDERVIDYYITSILSTLKYQETNISSISQNSYILSSSY